MSEGWFKAAELCAKWRATAFAAALAGDVSQKRIDAFVAYVAAYPDQEAAIRREEATQAAFLARLESIFRSNGTEEKTDPMITVIEPGAK